MGLSGNQQSKGQRRDGRCAHAARRGHLPPLPAGSGAVPGDPLPRRVGGQRLPLLVALGRSYRFQNWNFRVQAAQLLEAFSHF